MNEPHLNHPNDPQDAPDASPARYGYISPEQFPSMDERGRNDPAFKGIVDETFDIEEAEKIAQDLANDFGHPVTVDVTDDNGEALEPLTFNARSAQIEL